MKIEDLLTDYAEDAFYFVSLDDNFQDFCLLNVERDLSIDEFIAEFKQVEFLRYLQDKYGGLD